MYNWMAKDLQRSQSYRRPATMWRVTLHDWMAKDHQRSQSYRRLATMWRVITLHAGNRYRPLNLR